MCWRAQAFPVSTRLQRLPGRERKDAFGSQGEFQTGRCHFFARRANQRTWIDDMRLFQVLLGLELMRHCRRSAKSRLVVSWPLR